MFRFVFIMSLYYILSFQIRFSFSQSKDTNKICDGNCDVQIDIVAKFIKTLSFPSNIEKQLASNRTSKWSSCMEAAAKSWRSGIYKIQLEKINITDFEVFCEEDVDFGGWIVIQRRQSGSVDFYRTWDDYKEGFGELRGNYWIGLEKLYALTNSCEQELYIQMKTRKGGKYYAKYAEFLIGDESESYALKKLGIYNGSAGDSLKYHSGRKFSTYDRDSDDSADNCANKYKGGWWFGGCYASHLNGVYGNVKAGVHWLEIEIDESIAFAQMMIRPTQNCWKRLMLSNLHRASFH
ncbi:angiopoietin-related protein 2-like [Bactrocera tryoni]|uniref:angiopoietin-related protein 2-like n=1 Tax=Bactrocera tryoni TaxID=59916 RepID=UPI001A95FC9C|nr:angiopoietin-related protein 2-like [Bactrocera tryoni]